MMWQVISRIWCMFFDFHSFRSQNSLPHKYLWMSESFHFLELWKGKLERAVPQHQQSKIIWKVSSLSFPETKMKMERDSQIPPSTGLGRPKVPLLLGINYFNLSDLPMSLSLNAKDTQLQAQVTSKWTRGPHPKNGAVPWTCHQHTLLPLGCKRSFPRQQPWSLERQPGTVGC